jgi:hypothetical protein
LIPVASPGLAAKKKVKFPIWATKRSSRIRSLAVSTEVIEAFRA